MSRYRVLAVLALVALFVAACGGSASPQSSGPKQGGTLTTAIGIDADTLDPAAQTTTTIGQMVGMMVETLVKYNAQGKVEPSLATSWSQSSNGLDYTFTLRKGVKFQDGEPFNAQAVKFSIDRLLSPNTYKAQPSVLRAIQSVTAVDDNHVKITLSTPFAPFVSAMTSVAAGIIAPNSVNAHGNTPAKIVYPVGTGPYEYGGRVQGDHVTMNRFDGYWGTKPAYKTQLYKVVPEAASREALAKSGQADVIYQPPANDLPALEQSGSGVHVILGPDDRTIQIIVNNQDPNNPLLKNPMVRQALNYAVNKAAIVKNVQFGAATTVDSPAPSSVFGYCATGTYAYNPQKAKQMLQQAGAQGMTIKLMSPQGRYTGDYDTAQAVANNLRAVGLNVTVPNPPDWPTYVSTVDVAPSQASTDLHLLGWASTYLDASGVLTQFQKSNWPPAGLSTAYYDDPQVDALISKANSESSTSQRQQDYCSAEKKIWNAAPWIFLYNPKNPIVTTTGVKGIYGLPNEQFITTWATPA
ncbi:MAG: ABC transporter substrate-binding protein [Candidatus Dormiibacterota bacterium]